MTQNKTIIAITGSIATGKSQAVNIVRELGYKVIDSDKIAHEILEREDIVDKITKSFNGDILTEEKIDRSKLGKIVFGNRENLKKLNSITHPAIFEAINLKVEELNEKLIFLDIPLLIEELDKIVGYDLKINSIWLIYTTREIQIERLMGRDKINREYAIKKINSQMPVEDKIKFADIVIENNGSVDDLKRQIVFQLKKLYK